MLICNPKPQSKSYMMDGISVTEDCILCFCTSDLDIKFCYNLEQSQNLANVLTYLVSDSKIPDITEGRKINNIHDCIHTNPVSTLWQRSEIISPKYLFSCQCLME